MSCMYVSFLVEQNKCGVRFLVGSAVSDLTLSNSIFWQPSRFQYVLFPSGQNMEPFSDCSFTVVDCV